MKRIYLFLMIVAGLSACKKGAGSDYLNPPSGQPPLPDPSSYTIPVSATQVRAAFSFTKLRNTHPRILFTSAEIHKIKSDAATDQFVKPTYDEVISKADALLSSPLLNYALDNANLRIPSIHIFSNDQAPYLVLAYQFTGDSRYAERCWQQLDRMCSYPDWGANRHFLDAGIAAKAVAIAYDGLYDYLTPAQRTKLYNAVRDLVLQPGKSQIETNTGAFKWYLTNDNWNGICHGAMIMASLATYEMDSTFNSSVIALSANGMYKYIQSFDPDGASEEGLSYWSYGLSNTFLAFESMKRCMSSTFGLTAMPGFRKTGVFPYLVSGPVGTATFGDDYLYAGKENRFLSYFWFSKFFNDPNMAKTHMEMCLSVNASRSRKMNGWTDLLFYDKQLAGNGASMSLSSGGYVRGVDYAYFFESVSDPQSLYAGIHGGDNAASHGHLDAGSFFIQGIGENWAQGNLGLETPYPADYFTVTEPSYYSSNGTTANSRGRFYYYRVRTEGKNCLVFNPDARPEQDPSGVAVVSREANDNNGGFTVLDLTSAYKRNVTSYRRGLKLDRNRKIISIQDEFTASSPSVVYWIMHTAALDGTTISADGKVATMARNGKTFYLRIAAPANAVFEKVERSASTVNYLPETATIFSNIMAGKNSINQWYGKIQIRMSGIAAGIPATVRVDFSPTPLAESQPLVNLNSWTTSN